MNHIWKVLYFSVFHSFCVLFFFFCWNAASIRYKETVCNQINYDCRLSFLCHDSIVSLSHSQLLIIKVAQICHINIFCTVENLHIRIELCKYPLFVFFMTPNQRHNIVKWWKNEKKKKKLIQMFHISNVGQFINETRHTFH